MGRTTTISTPSDSYIYLSLKLGHESVTINLKTGSDVIPEVAAIDCRKGDIRKRYLAIINQFCVIGSSPKVLIMQEKKHVSRALESDKIMLHCNRVAIPVGI